MCLLCCRRHWRRSRHARDYDHVPDRYDYDGGARWRKADRGQVGRANPRRGRPGERVRAAVSRRRDVGKIFAARRSDVAGGRRWTVEGRGRDASAATAETQWRRRDGARDFVAVSGGGRSDTFRRRR